MGNTPAKSNSNRAAAPNRAPAKKSTASATPAPTSTAVAATPNYPDISDEELGKLKEYGGVLNAFQAEDRLTQLQNETTASDVWLLYRQREEAHDPGLSEKWVMLLYHVTLGDYHCHVPIKTHIVDGNKEYKVDSLPGESFLSVDLLARRQLARGDPEGAMFATSVDTLVHNLAQDGRHP